MGDNWHEYFEDFPEENPANYWSNGRYEIGAAAKERQLEAARATEQHALESELSHIVRGAMAPSAASFSEALEALGRRSFDQGSFVLGHREPLKQAIAEAEVPDCAGVYVITGIRDSDEEILYVGKSGTVEQDGHLKAQLMRERLSNKQGDVSRQTFFDDQVAELGLESLRFDWFETYRDGAGTPPFLAEAELAASFLSEHKRLPRWNRAL